MSEDLRIEDTAAGEGVNEKQDDPGADDATARVQDSAIGDVSEQGSGEEAADVEVDAVSGFDHMAAEAIRLAEARRRRKAAVREGMGYVQSIVMAVLLAMVIMTFLGRSFVVEGASMEPTLHNRERIIVEKVSYRFRAPVRGEIIVLRNPWRPDTEGWARAVEAMRELVDFSGSMRPYIKRIIGIAGDTIEISDGRVYLNGEELHEPYVAALPWSDYGPSTVPEGHVFVMGDNRNNSDDSRGSVGFLRIDRIVGRAMFRYYPLNKTCVLRPPDVY